MQKPNYIIVTPSFNENIGGVVVLHLLCDMLNRLGESAFVWPNDKPRLWVRGSAVRKLRNTAKWLLYGRKRLKGQAFRTHPEFITPLAREAHMCDAIVVYPEIYHHNPLDTEFIIRWILYKPGELTGQAQYIPRGLFFFFQEFFRDANAIPEQGDLLQVHWIRDDIYRQTNFGKRSGSCYLLRKGANRNDIAPPEGSICIDKKSHEEIAQIFNQVEYFYSYDPYTMYNDYAAMCGCTSIVIPMSGLSKEEWRPATEARYGVAYGIDNKEWSVQTHQDLLNRYAQQRQKDTEMVQNFIRKSEAYYQSKHAEQVRATQDLV